jgi:hypothetical protein
MPEQAKEATTDTGMNRYQVREVVGLFSTPANLQAAVDQLEMGGFDRSQISVLGKHAQLEDHLPHLSGGASSKSLEDDKDVPRDAPDDDSGPEFEAAAVGIPIYVLGVGGLAVVIASGGSLALAVGALVLGGAVGGGVGGLLAHAIGKDHRDNIAEQVRQGGLLLWVQPRNAEQEKKATELLKKNSASDVHVHQVSREWGMREVPFHDAQPDPALEHDPD